MSRAEVPPPVTRVLEAAGGWLNAGLGRVETRLLRLVGDDGSLAQRSRETIEAGGKRLRPMLVLLCAGPEADDRVISAAAAVELIHTATLVHDDVLDDAELRRGRPTVYAGHGRTGALTTGDHLFARAFAELARAGDIVAIARLSATSTSLARGELLQREDAWRAEVSEERYRERCELKTASLFDCACALGSESDPAAGASALEALSGFGRELGLAFQMLDDVLDVTGPEERIGKPRGTDLLDGTVTLPLIRARAEDPGLATLDLRRLDRAGAAGVCERIARTGALDSVRADALTLVSSARERLAGSGLAPERIGLLSTLADGVVDRYS